MAPAHPAQSKIFLILGLGLAFSLMGDSTLYTVLPEPNIAAEVGVSITMVGVLLGINRLARLAFNTPAGLLYERFPRRLLMITSLAIGSLSTLIFAIGTSPGILVLSRILWGAAWSGLWAGANMIVLDVASPTDRGVVSGRLQSGFFLGVAFSSAAGGLITDLLGFRHGLLLSSGLGAAVILLWLVFLPETHKQTPILAPSPAVKLPDSPRWGLIFRTGLPFFLNRLIFAGAVTATTILWLNSLVSITLGSGSLPLASLSGGFVAVRVLVAIAGTLWFGRLSDRLGNRWGVLTSLLLLSGAGLALMAIPALLPSVAGALLAAFAAGAVPLLTTAIIGDHVPAVHHGRYLGILLTVGDLGGAIGAPLALGVIPFVGIIPLYLACSGIYMAGALILNLARGRPAPATDSSAQV